MEIFSFEFGLFLAILSLIHLFIIIPLWVIMEGKREENRKKRKEQKEKEEREKAKENKNMKGGN